MVKVFQILVGVFCLSNIMFAQAHIEFENKINDVLSSEMFYKDNSVLYIPVVFHNLVSTGDNYVTDSIYAQQLQILNDAFNASNSDLVSTPAAYASIIGNSRIQFCKPSYDKFGDSTGGHTRTFVTTTTYTIPQYTQSENTDGINPWNTDSFLNVWIANLDSATIGVSHYPWEDVVTEGIIINRKYFGAESSNELPYNQGKALVRLVGQFLGLYDVDHGGECIGGNETDCATLGDLLCDTPPVFELKGSCLDVIACSEGSVFTCNYMSKLDDECKFMFTEQQAYRMRAALISFKPSLLNSKGVCYQKLNYDFQVEELKGNEEPICNLSNTFELVYSNNGILTVDSLSLKVYLEDNLVHTSLNTNSVFTGMKDSIQFTLTSLESGFYDLTIVGETSSDFYKHNDTIHSRIYVSLNDSNTTLPYRNDFNEADLRNDYFIGNPDDDITWKHSGPIVKASGKIGRALLIDNYFNKNEESHDYVIFPDLDLSVDSPVVCFNYAYGKHSSLNFETLELNVSLDCWASELSVLERSGSNLQTTENSQTSYWTPQSTNDWKEVCVELFKFKNETIDLKFNIENGYGNNFYLGDIAVVDTFIKTISIDELALNDLQVSPNPANHSISIHHLQAGSKMAIYDVFGKLVYELPNTQIREEIDLSLWNNGLYLIRVEHSNQVQLHKFIKQ